MLFFLFFHFISPFFDHLQIDNGIPIESWFDDTSDEELLHLLPLLKQLISESEIAGGKMTDYPNLPARVVEACFCA